MKAEMKAEKPTAKEAITLHKEIWDAVDPRTGLRLYRITAMMVLGVLSTIAATWGFILYAAWSESKGPWAVDPEPLKLHTVPSSEHPSGLLKEGKLQTDRAHFSSLLTGGEQEVAVDFFFFEATPAVSSSPPSPSPPSPPPPLAPPSTPERKAEPWWLAESRLPPRPAVANKTMPEADAPGTWAYEVLDPRPGTLLLARPSARIPPSQPYFAQAVILLVKACTCQPSIYGLLLSSPPRRNHTLGEMMCPVARQRYHSFVNHTVRAGGPVGPMWTTVQAAPLRGALEPLPGVHVGGCLADAQSKVDAGTLEADELTFYSGYAAWPIARLRTEMATGQWMVAKASSKLILEGVRKGGLTAEDVRAAM